MRCPVDDTELVMSDRQGVEIDYCPKCRGVWLDRGEIDKIIERSLGQDMESSPREHDHTRDDQRQYDNDRSHEEYGHHDQRKKRKDSWFGELFE